jgi:hypothetical protein
MRFGRMGGAGLEQNRQPIQYLALPIEPSGRIPATASSH